MPGTPFAAVTTSTSTWCGIEESTELVRCYRSTPQGLELETVLPGFRAIPYPVHCMPPSFDPSSVGADSNATYLSLVDATDLVYWERPSGSVLEGWTDLRRVDLPSSLQSLSSGAFLGAPKLGAIDLSRCSRLHTLPRHALGTSANTLNLTLLPHGLSTIESEAFLSPSGAASTDLRPFDFPPNLTTIEEGSFRGLWEAEVFNLSHTRIQVLPTGALDGLSSVQTLFLPDSVHTIEAGAFR